MSVTTVRLQADAGGHGVRCPGEGGGRGEVHDWLASWGTEDARDAPGSGR